LPLAAPLTYCPDVLQGFLKKPIGHLLSEKLFQFRNPRERSQEFAARGRLQPAIFRLLIARCYASLSASAFA
jgi:hypothetical protein